MNCVHVEELIPRYLDDDLPGDERRLVEAHLASCEACRASLEMFSSIEESLVRLRGAVPSWRAAEARLSRRLGTAARPSIASIMLAPPVLLGLAFIALGAVLFVRGAHVASAGASLAGGLSAAVGDYERLVSRLFEAAGGVSVLTLLSIYALLTAAIFWAGRELVTGFGRK
jgi:anti-sigma factor RsiW